MVMAWEHEIRLYRGDQDPGFDEIGQTVLGCTCGTWAAGFSDSTALDTAVAAAQAHLMTHPAPPRFCARLRSAPGCDVHSAYTILHSADTEEPAVTESCGPCLGALVADLTGVEHAVTVLPHPVMDGTTGGGPS